MLDSNNINNYTIFIAITAFNDQQVRQTVETALKQAFNSDRVHIGL
jgi:hypothetical protein